MGLSYSFRLASPLPMADSACPRSCHILRMLKNLKVLFPRLVPNPSPCHYAGDDWPFDQPRNWTAITMRQVWTAPSRSCLLATTPTITLGSSSAAVIPALRMVGWCVWRRWSRAIRAFFMLPTCRRVGRRFAAARTTHGSVGKTRQTRTTTTTTAQPNYALRSLERAKLDSECRKSPTATRRSRERLIRRLRRIWQKDDGPSQGRP